MIAEPRRLAAYTFYHCSHLESALLLARREQASRQTVMSRRPRESESESESEAEAEAPLRLDEPLAEEGLQDIDFDFDDPQERHAPSILGLLRKHPLADVAPRPALAALADLLAGDPRSVGTVVGSGGGDDLIGFVAAVDLAAYDAGAHAGVDAARACLGALAAGAARPVLVTHAFFVNTPPKVVAAAFQCFAADLDAAAFEADALVVPVRAADEDRDEAPRAKKARVAVSCASFHDDEFARASRDALDLGGGATLLALDPGQFAAAVARVGALAEET